MFDLFSRVGVLFANLMYDPNLPRPHKEDYDWFGIDVDWLIRYAGWLFILVVIAILVAFYLLVRNIVLVNARGKDLKLAEERRNKSLEDESSDDVRESNQFWVEHFRSKRDKAGAAIPICFIMIIVLILALGVVWAL
ncbi:MAG: hypothetical protein IJM30_02760 [Thermoguttaceae bacterium]|nr:hypothetical protein [Thermoguttaceae bacterium]